MLAWVSQKYIRLVRLPRLLCSLCAVIAAIGLVSPVVFAQTITNTANSSFYLPGANSGDLPVSLDSNTVVLDGKVPADTPATVKFYQYLPDYPGSTPIPFDGGLYYDPVSGDFVPLTPARDLNGNIIPLTNPVPVRETGVYHINEPIFITLDDQNRNTDPAVREFIDVEVVTSLGDREIIRMQETGPNTGIFAALVQSVDPTHPVTANDGLFSVGENTNLTVNYQDIFYPSDTSASSALVDPFGVVFDTVTGAPINGAVITVIDDATGLPADVFGDDGVSTFPATVTTGPGDAAVGTASKGFAGKAAVSGSVSAVDSSGITYTFPPGGFRYPFMKPGNYHFIVTVPKTHTVPSGVSKAALNSNPLTSIYAIEKGSYTDPFVILPGPALHIDIPADPSSGLNLQKVVSKTEASAGDFLQYSLLLTNVSGSTPATGITVQDILPQGMRYEPGSLHIDGAVVPNPVIAADGRTMNFPVGTLLPGGSAKITYVVSLGAGMVKGTAVNSAQATANGGVLLSNVADVAVTIKDPLMSDKLTIIGRVYEGDCNTPWEELKGLPNARILMEDGTYVVTDSDGQYHFEGVRPGVHVVQLDVGSLPGGLEPLSCIENTRFAGRNFSQFVDVRGGGLWRADFFTRERSGEVGIRLKTTRVVEQQKHVQKKTRTKSSTFTLKSNFDSCSANLKPEGVTAVDNLIQQLKGTDAFIEVTGHTDNQRLSPACKKQFTDNYGLSDARAKTVGNLLAKGIPSDRVTTHGKGEDEPVASNSTAEGMAQNRRIEVKMSQSLIEDAGEDVTTTEAVTGFRHRIDLDGALAVAGLNTMAMIPEGTTYVPGSLTVDGKAMPDPKVSGTVMSLVLGDVVTPNWHKVIEFSVKLDAKPEEPVQTEAKNYTVKAQFDSCSINIKEQGIEAIAQLAKELQGQDVERIELTGNTDNQRLSPACKAQFTDNKGLSEARARIVGERLAARLGLRSEQIASFGKGEENPVASNNTAEGMALNRRTDVKVFSKREVQKAVVSDSVCALPAYDIKAMANFEGAGKKRQQTPVVNNRLVCTSKPVATGQQPSTASEASPVQPSAANSAVVESAVANASDKLESARETVKTSAGKEAVVSAAIMEKQKERLAIVDDVEASGANIDWLSGQSAGVEWLYPGEDYNPRAPAIRITIKHAPGHKVILKRANGELVNLLNFDGSRTSADKSFAVSLWRGVNLIDGPNTFIAEIQDESGNVVGTLTRTINYANTPVRAELVPEQSILVADGITTPVLAVRFLDRNGKPVRAGVTGPVEVSAPYTTKEQVEMQQNRQLAGLDRFSPQYHIEGDKGIAYIELAPTSESGAVKLDFSFQSNTDTLRKQEMRAWLEPDMREWVIVGFAEGTVGYNTLKGNMEPLSAQGVDDGGYGNGQISMYAKGRVKGKWIMTMAYDSDKEQKNDQQKSLLSQIDPDEYYTLYGDGTEQRYDAASQDNLYLKIEREQFYAMFGDYETGLSKTQLSRYSRTLNGVKIENGGGPVNFIVFAADTPQSFVRDELQGDGTSGLYRLSQKNIVLNSEHIRIETRDRLHSEQIVESRLLLRHIDYDIDYSNGTIFFRQPVQARDRNFNPTFIVAEYETFSMDNKELNAGGRVAVPLADGKVEVGVTGVQDKNNTAQTDLAGVDLTVQVGDNSELRVEDAQTDGQMGVINKQGEAWLTEFETHSEKLDALFYARRQGSDFGVNQLSASGMGQQKIGVEPQYRLTENYSIVGEAYNQENLDSAATRDALISKLKYENDNGGWNVGAQTIVDRAGPTGVLANQSFRSDQATAGANRFFLNKKLELMTEAEYGINGNSESIDYPDRLMVGSGYALTDNVRLMASQEYTDSDAYSTATTRAGVQILPWTGARIDTSVNQSRISEYGPRTYSQYGLTQAVPLNDHWTMDFSADISHTLEEPNKPVLVINPDYPITSGGSLGMAGLTEDYTAFSTGAAYREEIWSWTGRAETRNGETTDRNGITSNFLREAEAGVAFATSAQIFETSQSTGTEGRLMSVDFSWAFRPLGVQWSILNRLQFMSDEVDNGIGVSGSGLFGNDSLVTIGDASSRRIINNFALNHVSRAWTGEDRHGNLFNRYERNQWSLYYGSKYSFDKFDDKNYSGYTDLIGTEVRHDITEWMDIGVQASSLNSWKNNSHTYSIGPMIGFSPVVNGWITVGYNYKGFYDPDFDAARYTGKGFYLQLRFKFDQKSRLRDFKSSSSDDMSAPGKTRIDSVQGEL